MGAFSLITDAEARVPRVVVVGLASCFGCQLQITNAEEHLMEILGQIDVRYWQLVTSEDGVEDFDVAIIEGAVTTIERGTMTVKTDCGKTDTEYIRSVTVNYPAGNYIRRVSAIYRNDTGGSLAKYNITYEMNDGGLYTIYYSVKEKSLNIPPATSQSVYRPYGKAVKNGTFRYPHTDKILKGAYSGGGVMLTCGQADVWHPYSTARYMSLYSIFSFISPRVEW